MLIIKILPYTSYEIHFNLCAYIYDCYVFIKYVFAAEPPYQMLSNPNPNSMCYHCYNTLISFIKSVFLQQLLRFQSLSLQGFQDPVQYAKTRIGQAPTRALPGSYVFSVSGIVVCAVVFACARKNAPNADLLLLRIYCFLFFFFNLVTNQILSVSFKFSGTHKLKKNKSK